MNVASNLLCLEQGVSANHKTVEAFLVPLGDLRDGLYELYCDSGDRRLRALVDADGPWSSYVSALYALSDEILEALVPIASEGRCGPTELAQVLQGIAVRCAAFAHAAADLPDQTMKALESLGIDATNPVDPLRNASQHLGEVVRAAKEVTKAASRLQ
jgi:hypothetical protein